MGEIFRNATLSNFDAFLTLSDYKSKRGQPANPVPHAPPQRAGSNSRGMTNGLRFVTRNKGLQSRAEIGGGAAVQVTSPS